MIPPHKYQTCKVRSADATGSGKFPAGLFRQVHFAYSTCSHSFTPTGPGEQGRLSHHCTTEFTDVTQGQGVCILARKSSNRAEGFGARLDPSATQPDCMHTGLRIIQSRAHTVVLPRVIKVSEAASRQLPSAQGLCPNKGWGGRPVERAGRTPHSAPLRIWHPTPCPGKEGFGGHRKQSASFDRNQLKKIEGKIPFCEYSKCHCKLSVKQKLIFSLLQTPASFQFPTAKSLFLLSAVKVGKVK